MKGKPFWIANQEDEEETGYLLFRDEPVKKSGRWCGDLFGLSRGIIGDLSGNLLEPGQKLRARIVTEE